MKNAVLTILVLTGFTFLNSCEKCYKCHNICQVCTEQHPDTTLTITVCSDVFGEEYYLEYLDSLKSPNLGWTCVDGGTTRTSEFCGTSTNNSIQLLNKKEQGLICAPE